MTHEGQACRDMIELALSHYLLPDSESAIRLLCMVAAHESGDFTYVRQIGGPALSFFQMEPMTFQEIAEYCQRKQIQLADELPCTVWRLVFDPVFAAAMARVFFMRFPEPLPEPDDIEGLASYAKDYWNTELGKATESDYFEAWSRHYED